MERSILYFFPFVCYYSISYMRYFRLLSLLIFVSLEFTSLAQKVQFDLKTSPNISFDFNTIQKYNTGIVYLNAMTLNLEVEDPPAPGSAISFDLYVGAEDETLNSTTVWHEIQSYSNTGTTPGVDLVQLRFRNTNSTSQVNGFFNLTEYANPTYIIGTPAKDGIINCPLQGTNEAGKYDTNPGCFKFRVDIKIKPDFTYKSGLYELYIHYRIVENL